MEDAHLVGRVLRALWRYRTEQIVTPHPERALPPVVEGRFSELVSRIEAGSSAIVVNALSGTADVLSFDTVSRDLERALGNAKGRP